MKNIPIIIAIILLSIPLLADAQSERKYIREGVKSYDKKTFSESEIAFRKALAADSTSLPAGYDMGNSLYKQDKFKDAGNIYQKLTSEKTDLDNDTKADIFHNLGNTYLKQGDYAQSIEAYKNALRLRPGDDETRYNLVYAQTKLKEQQQKQNKDKKDQNKKDQDKNKKDQKNKDQENKDKEKQDQKKQENQQNKDQQQNKQENKDQQNQKKKGQELPPPKQLSSEEIQKMLQAIQQQELKTLKEYEAKKTKTKASKTEKDW